MATDKLQLTLLAENKLALMKSHLSMFLGTETEDLLLGDYELQEGVYSNKYESAFFLNTNPTDLISFFISDDQKNFLFIINGSSNPEDGLYSYFPINIEADPNNLNNVPQVLFKSVIYPINPGAVSWTYLYFSTDDTTNQKALWEKYINVNKFSFEVFNFFTQSAWQYQADRQAMDTNAVNNIAIDTKKWQGGLYFSNTVTGWPFDAFIQDNGGFLEYLGKASGIDFKLSGSIFYPKYADYPVQNPVLHAKIPLQAQDYPGSFISRTELAIEFFSKSNYSDDLVQIGLNGKLFLDNNKYELDITAMWPVSNNIFELNCKCKINEIPFFDHTLLPGLENPPQAEVDVLLRISLEDKSFHSAQFIATIENWPIITDILALKELKFGCTIYNTGTSKALSASVDAIAILGNNNIQLICGGSYPEGQFYFGLYQPLNLHEIVAAFFGNDGGLPATLAITELSGEFNYNTKQIYFSIAIGSEIPWQITSEFSLKNIRLNIGGQGNYTGTIFCIFNIGKDANAMTFSAAAIIGNGWSFEAKFIKQKETDSITIAKMAGAFGFAAPQLPDFISNITITEAGLSFKSPSPVIVGDDKALKPKTEKHFKLSGTDKVNGNTISFDLKLDITYHGGIENIAFAGNMTVNDQYVFDIIQQQDGTGKIFLAAFHQSNTKSAIDIGKLLEGLGVANAPSMELTLNDAFFAKKDDLILMVADIGAGMNLSNLPLVGKVLPTEASVNLALRVLYANTSYKSAVSGINNILPGGISKIAIPDIEKPGGLNLVAEIRIGGQSFLLALDIPFNATNQNGKETYKIDVPTNSPNSSPSLGSPPVSSSNSTIPIPVADGITWFKIGKTFGPVIFNRIGLTYSNGIITVYPDAALSMAGLTFTLNGLSLSSPITEFKPTFNLKGLGLDFKKGTLEIGASFLRRQIIVNGETIDEYDGLAIISTEKLSISALGSYCYVGGHSSLFIYAYLNQALGGPSFFFVEGLSAAFGYNRSLLMPTIDQVSTFPLVRQVMGGADPATATKDRAALLTQQLDAISKYVPPDIGQMFFAIGIRFTSFKLIDSFVLLAIQFGNHFEIDVLGQSNIIVPSVVPPGVPPLAEIKIQLMAKFLPEEGTLAVLAQLTTDSYIFTRDCHLSGGAAFYCWFKGEHEGDFVVTMGGYHPAFKVPAHYPKVPRLALNWQVSSKLHVKGDMYFALCPHAFMAGGHLEALFIDGPLRAWFKSGADFLITWQPYHYDARMYIDIGGSYTYHLFGTHHISIDVGADVHIWGPEFAGTATISLWICDIKVKFGPQGTTAPNPISWSEFQTKCLPAKEKIISAAITQGKHTEDENKISIVNSKELTIVVNSAVPVNQFNTPATVQPEGRNNFGLAPMAVSKNIFSQMNVSISRLNDTLYVDLDDYEKRNFIFSSVAKKVPSAVWGKSFSTGINAAERTIELVTGLTITTKEPIENPIGGNAFISLDQLLDHSTSTISCIEKISGLKFSVDNNITSINNLKSLNPDFKNLCTELDLDEISVLTIY